MEAAGVAIANDFDWMAQLRYYYAPELSQEIQVRMITWLELGLASNPNLTLTLTLSLTLTLTRCA